MSRAKHLISSPLILENTRLLMDVEVDDHLLVVVKAPLQLHMRGPRLVLELPRLWNAFHFLQTVSAML